MVLFPFRTSSIAFIRSILVYLSVFAPQISNFIFPCNWNAHSSYSIEYNIPFTPESYFSGATTCSLDIYAAWIPNLKIRLVHLHNTILWSLNIIYPKIFAVTTYHWSICTLMSLVIIVVMYNIENI